jgi:hypothetical protein
MSDKFIIVVVVVIIIINKFEKKNIITIKEKPLILFEGIKNYKHLGQTSLILLLILLYSLILLNLKKQILLLSQKNIDFI